MSTRATELLKAAGFDVYPVPVGLAVSSSLIVKRDGDRAGCYVVGPGDDGLYSIEDDGTTLFDSTDADAHSAILFASGFGVTWEDDDCEFSRSGLRENDLPRAVTEFLVMLGRIAAGDAA